jgi:hypothetical protein
MAATSSSAAKAALDSVANLNEFVRVLFVLFCFDLNEFVIEPNDFVCFCFVRIMIVCFVFVWFVFVFAEQAIDCATEASVGTGVIDVEFVVLGVITYRAVRRNEGRKIHKYESSLFSMSPSMKRKLSCSFVQRLIGLPTTTNVDENLIAQQVRLRFAFRHGNFDIFVLLR